MKHHITFSDGQGVQTRFEIGDYCEGVTLTRLEHYLQKKVYREAMLEDVCFTIDSTKEKKL